VGGVAEVDVDGEDDSAGDEGMSKGEEEETAEKE